MRDPQALIPPLAITGFVYDFALRELRHDGGEPVELRPQTLGVLDCLARHAGTLVERAELMQEVWRNLVVTDDSLVQCIVELRRAIGDSAHQLIRTVPKRGYRLVTTPSAREPSDADEIAQFSQEVYLTETADHARVAYAVAGVRGAPTVVRCSHWITHLEWDWRCPILGARLRRLARHFRLVRFDARGQGLSGREVEQATLDQAVLDLESVVDAAALERFSLLGISGGAAQAIRYAARHPERVERIVLIGGFARGVLECGADAKPPEYIAASARLILEGWGMDNAAFRQLFTTMMWPGASAEQSQAFNHMQRLSASPQGAASYLGQASRYNATDDLALVRCPILLLHSKDDFRVPLREAEFIAARVASATLVPLDSANHTPLPGDPCYEQAMRLALEFLQGSETESVRQ